MKRTGLVVLGTVALIAMNTVTAASASAEAPEFGRCLAHSGGKFKSGSCTTAAVPGEEKDEFYPAFGKAANGEERPLVKKGYTVKAVATTEKPFIFTGTGEVLGAESQIACTEAEAHGEIISNKEATEEQLIFKGCGNSGWGGCSTGEIDMVNLVGMLVIESRGYNKETKTEEPVNNKLAVVTSPTVGEQWSEFRCGTEGVVSVRFSLRGHLMNSIKTNAMVLTYEVKFNGLKGNQKPEHYSTGINLETGKQTFTEELSLEMADLNFPPPPAYEEWGLTQTSTSTFEEKVEASSLG